MTRGRLAPTGRGALSQGGAQGAPTADLAALARGGRINFFGFVLRLLARLPFLFIAGRIYGAEELGRFAYAVLIVEFAAQLATLGLKRGLAQQLAQTTGRPHAYVVWDALLVAALGAAALMVSLCWSRGVSEHQITGLNGCAFDHPVWPVVLMRRPRLRHYWLNGRARAIVEPGRSSSRLRWSFIHPEG